ncbi:MAG: single-stranded-DNA-specific exonuclease RecJ [Clostridia bacterium]|nr:single-stranded-DNA-specific exonuclease RecJ [Clostridia bacterium]
MEKQWIFLSENYDKDALLSLSRRLKISPAISMAMLNRGINADNAEEFLHPSVLHDPFLMADMAKGTERLKRAIENREKICIYGDYDADGVSSSAMMYGYFAAKGIECDVYIPSREGEGYGVNADAVRKIAEGGADIILTVDTGISAVFEAELAKELGIDMIITDHHECGDNIPDACAVINPKRRDCGYPFKMLAGAGVAFKLICAMEGDSGACLKAWGEYVAMATLADVVPLSGENRTLVCEGLKKLRTESVPWFDELAKASGLNKAGVNSYQAAFMIAPRINAAGRLNNAYLALELLKVKDAGTARRIAQELEQANARRKELGDAVLKEASEQIKGADGKKVLVLAGEGWHAGVIGIAASRIAELYHKSVILISLKDGEGKGSGRAVQGFNLYDALTYAKDSLIKFGGHEKAAGLTVKEENIPEFDRIINEYADKTMKPDDLIPKLYIDCAISCETSLLQLCDEQALLEPFGEGNRKPVFAVMGAQITALRQTRDGRHLMLRFLKRGNIFSAIGFGFGALIDTLGEGDIIDIAATLDINEYQGNITPQFQVIDIKRSRLKR